MLIRREKRDERTGKALWSKTTAAPPVSGLTEASASAGVPAPLAFGSGKAIDLVHGSRLN